MAVLMPSIGRTGWISASVGLHFAFVIAMLLYAPPPMPEIPIFPIDLVAAPAPTEPPKSEMLHFKQATNPRVRESIAVPKEILALAPPPVDAVLEAQAVGGGVTIDVAASHSLSGFALGGYGGGFTGTGVGAGNGTAAAGSFTEYVGGLRQSGLDVVFVIDSTGSMGWLLGEVKDRVRALSSWIRTLVPVTRFGVVVYRDEDDPEYVTQIQPLTLNIGRVRRFLDDVEAHGRGDIPEAVHAGLEVAVSDARWKSDSRRVIIVLGDAPPHVENVETAVRTAQSFSSQGGTVTTVDTSFDANPTLAAKRLKVRVEDLQTLGKGGIMPEFERIARAGGGDAASLEGERHVARQLALLIFGEEWADEVRPLLGNL